MFDVVKENDSVFLSKIGLDRLSTWISVIRPRAFFGQNDRFTFGIP
jgi:hypothetical protein